MLDALEDNGVLVFHGLNLSPEAQVALCERLGEVDRSADGHHPVSGIYPITLDKSKNKAADYLKASFVWHIDGCTPMHDECPQKATVLSAQQVARRGGETEFANAYAAYETLSDPDRRARYDRFGPDESINIGDPFGSGGMGGLGDLFDAFFGGGGGGSPFGGRQRGPSGPPRGPDLEAVASLSFTEAVFGAQHDVSVRTAVTCDVCSGKGAAEGSSATQCPDCGGSGEVRSVRQTMLGQIVSASVCRTCSGQGEIVEDPCENCSGDGRVVTDKTYTVDVPAGVDTGATLRLTGRGAVGPRGGPAGDLYVKVSVAPHDRFVRQGFDLVHDLPITMTQATLGHHIAYETLDGDEDLVIPRGTQSGRVFRLKGRGVPQEAPRARELYTLACNAGVVAGCAHLGSLYEAGRGVPRDPARAYDLRSRAWHPRIGCWC